MPVAANAKIVPNATDIIVHNEPYWAFSDEGGALAEELSIPERCLVEVPDNVSDEQAVFAEPLAAALHILDDAHARCAIVLGDGKLGLLSSLALARSGIETMLVGHHSEKLELAEAAGVRTVLEEELESQSQAELVVEATGSARGMEQALRLCAPLGSVVLKTTVAAKHELDLSPIVINELKVIGSPLW